MLFVGQMLVSDGALEYFTDNAEVLWQVPVAVALLAVYYAVDRRRPRLAHRPADRRRRRHPRAVPRHVDRRRRHHHRGGRRRRIAAGLLNVLALPLDLRDLVFLGHIEPTIRRWRASNGGVLAVLAYLLVLGSAIAVLLWRYREVEL